MLQGVIHYPLELQLPWVSTACIIILESIPIPRLSNRNVFFRKTARIAIRMPSSHLVLAPATVSVSFGQLYLQDYVFSLEMFFSCVVYRNCRSKIRYDGDESSSGHLITSLSIFSVGIFETHRRSLFRNCTQAQTWYSSKRFQTVGYLVRLISSFSFCCVMAQNACIFLIILYILHNIHLILA